MDAIQQEAPEAVAEDLHPLQQQEGKAEPHPLDPESKGEETQAEEEQKESKTYSQEEVDRIVRKAKKNAAYLSRKEAEAELYRRMAEKPAAPAPEQRAQDAAPNRDQFESYEEYLEARADWRADQKVKAALAEVESRQQRAVQDMSQQQQVQRFQSQLAEARKTLPDFEKVMDAADEVPITQAMRDAILESEVGALLTYHLAKHPGEASRISQLSATAQIKALGRIEAGLTAAPAPRVSKAPDPIKPLSGGSGGVSDPSKMSMDD